MPAQETAGLLLSFEGPEGAGKSTQLARLAARLRDAGYAVTQSREPGGTALGGCIRELLLSPGHAPQPMAELFLLLASRAQLCGEVLRPALGRGEVVLLDRFTDSTLAYQGAGRGLPLDMLRALNAQATGGLVPSLTLLLDIPAEAGLRRAAGRGVPDRLEAGGLAFHQRVRAGFLDLAAAEPQRIAVLDARQDKAALESQVWEQVSRRLPHEAAPRQM